MSVRSMSLALASLVLAAGCGAPVLLLPGGALEGSARPAQEDWSNTDELNTFQLETRPNDPYSVNIWAVGIDDSIYIHAGANRSTWVEHIEANPDVRLKAEEAIYELRAARVTGQGEFDVFSEAYEEKYGSRPRNELVNEAYLFRLTSR